VTLAAFALFTYTTMAFSTGACAEELVDGEFGQLKLGRPLVAGMRIPTVRELRDIVSRPRIETVVLLKLHGDKNNHYLPSWSDDGQRLAFQRSDVGSGSTKLLMFSSLSALQPTLLSSADGANDQMLRWGVNSAASYAFARTTRDSKAAQIYVSEDGAEPVAKTKDTARNVYPALYRRTDGICRLVYERNGQLIHEAWTDGESVESGQKLGSGSQPRWDRTGTRLLIARQREGAGRIGAYNVVIRNLRTEREQVVPINATDDVRSPCWSPDERFVSFYHRKSGENHPWQIALAPVDDVGQVRDLGEQVVVNVDFESSGPAWEPTNERIWGFSHARHKQAYYPLVGIDVKSGAMIEVDYPQRCTTPNDLAVNPTADTPELAFIARDGLTQDVFVILLNHY
jgi:dipeptidyl aminopeptidase/acylaminoacyl peptidase